MVMGLLGGMNARHLTASSTGSWVDELPTRGHRKDKNHNNDINNEIIIIIIITTTIVVLYNIILYYII